MIETEIRKAIKSGEQYNLESLEDYEVETGYGLIRKVTVQKIKDGTVYCTLFDGTKLKYHLFAIQAFYK